jgi:hypothetical protein
MNGSRISRVVVVVASSLTIWGFKVSVQCGHFEKRVFAGGGSFGDFGNKGIL